MPVSLILKPVKKALLVEIAKERFGDMVKAVIDVQQEIMVIGVSMHVDAEAQLLEQGAEQQNLWGINIYPHKTPQEWIEFDSIINLRPWQNNDTRGVDHPEIQQKIKMIVAKLVVV